MSRIARLAIRRAIRDSDGTSELEVVRLAEAGLVARLEQLDGSSVPSEFEAEQHATVQSLREAISELGLRGPELVQQEQAMLSKQRVDQRALLKAQAQSALGRVRDLQPDWQDIAPLQELGYTGRVPSLAYAIAATEIELAGGHVEGPHSKLSESE